MINLDEELGAQLESMINNASMAFIITDPRLPDNPIIMCNAAFIKMSGYERDEIIGRNCRFMTGKDTEADKTQLIIEAIRTHQPVLVQITNYKRDGTAFQNAVMIAPTFDDEGQLAYFLGSQVEVPNETHQTMLTRYTLAKEQIDLLTPQQRRVIIEVAKGHRNKQIAHILEISESTVKMHRAEALAKMNVSTTAEAIRLAVLAGL